jgi:predicted nucleic acid-binding protein
VTGDDPKQAAAAEKFVSGGAWKHRNLTVQDAEVVAAALLHYRSRPSLGFSDCLMLEIARKAGHVPLGTFDRTLAKLDGAERIA